MLLDFSPGSLFAGLMVSSIGFALFVYGKKQQRWPQLIAGVLLSVFPCFVASVAWMLGIGAAVLAGLIFFVRAGY